MTPEVEAAKVIIDKPIEVLKLGEGIRHVPIDPGTIQEMRGRLLAEYQTAILVEIDRADLDDAVAQAGQAHLRMIIHEEYDRIQINGFEYTSGTPCPDLRSDQLLDSIPDGEGLWIVQMIGPPIQDWHETLGSAGTVINVLPENTFVIRGTQERVVALREANGFQHIEPYQPGFKIQPRLARAPGKVRAIIHLDTGQNLEAALTVIEGMVDRRFSRETGGPFKHLLVELTPEQVLQLAQRPEVIRLEPYVKQGFSDERHAMVAAGQHNDTKPDDVSSGLRYQDWLEDKGFCGDPPTQGCISYSTKVAVVDSGLDRNTCKTFFTYPQSNGDLPDTYDPVSGICDWAEIPPPPVPHHVHHEDLDGRETRFFCLDYYDAGEEEFVDRCFEVTDPYDDEIYRFSDFPMGNNLGHGTAVASIIGGDPIHGTQHTDSEGYFEGTGIAPTSEIVLAKIKNWEFSPDEYERLISKVFSIGTRFANNSWNEYADWNQPSDPNWPELYHVVEYNTFSQMADRLVRDGDGGFDDHENGMTIVFSAGNYRWADPGVNPDPNPYYQTIAPGNAKNIISVGSSSGWEEPGESRDCCIQEFSPAEPACTDGDGDDISDVLNSSTRGTRWFGGRFKPDIVAPGTRLRAAEMSDLSGPGSDYWCFGGTSGAAPQVTGAAILIDAWFYDQDYPRHPSPAMIKAMLVAHAADLGLEGGADRYTGASLAHSPSHPQGWGRLELDALFSPGVEVDWFDEDHEAGAHPDSGRFSGLTTKWIQDFEVDDPDSDVIVVMAFTDAPGTPGAASSWVNNLNLTVIDKDLSKSVGPPRYYGNKFLSGSRYSERYLGGLSLFLSPINNIEVVRVPGTDFVNGDFSIRVHAATLAGKAVPGLDPFHNANQDFALYAVNATAVGGSGGGTEP